MVANYGQRRPLILSYCDCPDDTVALSAR